MEQLRGRWIAQMYQAATLGQKEREETLYGVLKDTEAFNEGFSKIQAELLNCYREADEACCYALQAEEIEEAKEQEIKKDLSWRVLDKLMQLEPLQGNNER
ncbi:hypothetical protein [Marinococcus luteus]|uniref:hypothetical protein n=1 Tax=Marinococcus luteus TaxID=1122204 RepID=UPI002ACCA06F|nr:hypothetical protein [Marinococcus luteus]MDZ5782077.1 hypothetical protein [Marinococcus luteus]